MRTASGATLCAYRFSGHCVAVSRDDDLNWDASKVIDYPAWVMGCAVEVAPDVVLLTCMNPERNTPLMAQLVRVPGERIEPRFTAPGGP